METLEKNSGVPFTKMNAKERRDIMNQLFPSQTMDQIANMTEEQFDNYVKERFQELEKSQETEKEKAFKKMEAELEKGKTPQQEAKEKRDTEKAIRTFAEMMAREPNRVFTDEMMQFYKNNAQEIEEELKKI